MHAKIWFRLRQSVAHVPLARFRPKLLDALHGYNRTLFAKDLGAGITVGIVALPLATAFAIASGVTPQAGLITAIIGGFLVAALGGSRVQIGGPAGAFIVVVYGIVERYGLANLLISTMCAGVLLFAMGLLRLGQLIRFIPVSIVIGFTNGIATLIILSQIKEALGLDIAKMPADFFQQINAITAHLHTVNPWAIALCLSALALIIFWPKLYIDGAHRRWHRWLARAPGTVVAIVLASIVVAVFDMPVATIGTRFGEMPQTLPQFALPDFSWVLVKQLFAPTITLALLGAIESLLCARLADNVTDDRHDPNQELMAQGVANVCVPFFGGLPTTGTIARTMTNVKSGAVTPIAGIVHALTLLMIVWVAAPLATHIPLAALAAILLFVGWNMGEWREFVRLKAFSLSYRTILISTFLLTVCMDLTVAVEVGLVLSSLFFIYRMTTLTRVEHINLAPTHDPQAAPKSIAAYRLFGSLFFGTVNKLEPLSEPSRAGHTPPPKVIVLDLAPLLSLDSTGLDALESLRRRLTRLGGRLILGGASGQPLSLLKRSGFLDRNGAENHSQDFAGALAQAYQFAQKIGDL